MAVDTEEMNNRPSRRSLLTGILGALAGAAGLAGASVASAAADVGVQDWQSMWRFCDKCYVLFYYGNPDDGVCKAGGAHRAQGWIFTLMHNVPGDANHQQGWRFCPKCYALHWDPGKLGLCPAGGWHLAQGFVFTMPHDLGETPTRQANWRYCWNCTAMFYWGNPSDGLCSANGKEHWAEGYNFCLYHL